MFVHFPGTLEGPGTWVCKGSQLEQPFGSGMFWWGLGLGPEAC